MKKHRIVTLIAVCIFAIGAIIGITGCGTEPIAEVPDPQYFFQNTHDELNEHDDVKQVILRSDNSLWTHAAAYVNLLKYSGKYEFVSFDENSYPSGDYKWLFEYNGSEEIKDAYYAQIEIEYYSNTNGRENYAVWITLHDIDNFELVENDIYDPDNIYGTESYVTETQSTESNADYFETTPTTDSSSWGNDSSGGDSDSSDDDSDWAWEDDNDDLYDAEPICGVCNGDGDCGTCGGDGLLHSSASDEEDRNCYSCSGSGNCRSCRGSGRL